MYLHVSMVMHTCIHAHVYVRAERWDGDHAYKDHVECTYVCYWCMARLCVGTGLHAVGNHKRESVECESALYSHSGQLMSLCLHTPVICYLLPSYTHPKCQKGSPDSTQYNTQTHHQSLSEHPNT